MNRIRSHSKWLKNSRTRIYSRSWLQIYWGRKQPEVRRTGTAGNGLRGVEGHPWLTWDTSITGNASITEDNRKWFRGWQTVVLTGGDERKSGDMSETEGQCKWSYRENHIMSEKNILNVDDLRHRRRVDIRGRPVKTTFKMEMSGEEVLDQAEYVPHHDEPSGGASEETDHR